MPLRTAAAGRSTIGAYHISFGTESSQPRILDPGPAMRRRHRDQRTNVRAGERRSSVGVQTNLWGSPSTRAGLPFTLRLKSCIRSTDRPTEIAVASWSPPSLPVLEASELRYPLYYAGRNLSHLARSVEGTRPPLFVGHGQRWQCGRQIEL